MVDVSNVEVVDLFVEVAMFVAYAVSNAVDVSNVEVVFLFVTTSVLNAVDVSKFVDLTSDV